MSFRVEITRRTAREIAAQYRGIAERSEAAAGDGHAQAPKSQGLAEKAWKG